MFLKIGIEFSFTLTPLPLSQWERGEVNQNFSVCTPLLLGEGKG